jgi:hypothetical protein
VSLRPFEDAVAIRLAGDTSAQLTSATPNREDLECSWLKAC